MTAAELLTIARKGRPNVRYAVSKNGGFIGGWSETHGRFVPVAALTLTGQWIECRYEILINEQPAVPPEDWKE